MPFVTSVPGAILFAVSMAAFLGQEFSQGIGTPDHAEVTDERGAVWYLEVLPVVLVGVGLALGTWPGLVLCTVGVAPGVLRRITVEERAMRTALGPAYEEYASGRARLVPGIW